MNNRLITLDCGDDVVLLQKDTFKVSRLKELVREQICSKWDKLCLDFCSDEPDEPESPLDDIRKMIQAEAT